MNKKLTTDANLGLGYRVTRSGRLSESMVRRLFAPAQTLAADSQIRLAADNALQDAGVYGLLKHSINLGQMPLITFLGYSALQQIQQNSLVRTVIEVPLRDMVSPGFELEADPADDQDLQDIAELLEKLEPGAAEAKQNAAVTAIKEQWERHKLDAKIYECLKLSGYEGGGLLFVDTGAPADELKEPLVISRHSAELSAERPLKFKVIDPINVFPGIYNSAEPLGDHYFDPQTWWVLGTQVHCSRLIKFVQNEAPLLLKPAYNFLGIPQAQLYWDYVIHWNKNRESANRLLNKFSLTAFKTNMEDALTGGTVDDLNRRIDYLAEKRSNDGILLMDKENEDVVNITTPLSGVTDIVKQSLEALAVISGIPAVKLFGQSPSGFNSTGESDLNNYANLIESRRRVEMRPQMQRLVDILQVKYTEFLDPIKLRFLPFDSSHSQQNAQTELTKAQTAAARIQAGITSAEEERQRLANDKESGMTFIDVDELPQGGGSLPDDFMQDEVNNGGSQGSEAERGDTDAPQPSAEAPS